METRHHFCKKILPISWQSHHKKIDGLQCEIQMVQTICTMGTQTYIEGAWTCSNKHHCFWLLESPHICRRSRPFFNALICHLCGLSILREKMGPSLLLGSVFECLNNINVFPPPSPPPMWQKWTLFPKIGQPIIPNLGHKGPTMEPIKLHIILSTCLQKIKEYGCIKLIGTI